MDTVLKTSIWQQFGAAIDMFDDCLIACPDHFWTYAMWENEEDPRYGQVWFIAYHTVFWLDLYLIGDYASFKPPEPFVRGKLPEQPYTKEQVRAYLLQCRQKCQSVIEGLTDERAYQVHTFSWMQPTFLELQMYSMRHVQEHAAQLNYVLGRNGVTGPDWIAKARDSAAT